MMERDLKEIHELLMENVREENEKSRKELSNSLFNINTKNNLISVAREALKPKNLKQYKVNNNSIKPIKISRASFKKRSKISKKSENIKTNNIFSDKKYLNLMLKDLKLISSSIKKRQNRFSPSYSNNNSFLFNNNKKNKNKYNSYGVTKSKNIKKINLKLNNNIMKYNNVNLLTQIIGDQNSNENSKYENNITEDNNNYFNNLCYDNNEKKIYVKDNTNNYY